MNDLIESLTASSMDDDVVSPAVFTEICQTLGISNISYIGMNLPQHTHFPFFVHNTYGQDWYARYFQQNYVTVDPVVSQGLSSVMPFDWADIPNLKTTQTRFMGEAKEFKIGPCGLSIPLRGLFNERALISVSADYSARDWRDFKRERLQDVKLAAGLLHRKIVGKPKGHTTPLSPREQECLLWLADGKTYRDVALLMKISERTIKFHLESAKRKLNCITTTQAVAVAIRRNLL